MIDGATPELIKLISRKSERLLEIAYKISSDENKTSLKQSLLTHINAEASILETLLENHGIHGNKRWHHLFSFIQAMKSFSKFGYILLQTNAYTSQHCSLEKVSESFQGNTAKLLEIYQELMRNLCAKLVKTAMELPLSCKFSNISLDDLEDHILQERFEQDLDGMENVDKDVYVVNLATAFLNLSGEYQNMRPPLMSNNEKVMKFLEETMSEERMRVFELKAYNLRVLYNKHVNRPFGEPHDTELVHLSNYLSLVFHLIELCLILIRYSSTRTFDLETNISTRFQPEKDIILEQDYRWILVSYVLYYINAFFTNGAEISRSILSHYVEVVEMEMPIPPYGGFHVRPSTLIAKIIGHYGSPVKMKLEDEVYDAAVPLDLFRANERINRRKKNFVAEKAHEVIKSLPQNILMKNDGGICLDIFLQLQSEGTIDLYAPITENILEKHTEDETLQEFVMKNIIKLMVEGKLNIPMDCSVTFEGDRRTLDDIMILAQNGYGEDDRGNNIPLPKKLTYLQREWV